MTKKTIATHDGAFHADDCFAVATLLLLFGNAEVVRTRDTQKIAAADFAVDVGEVYDAEKNRFDHHQKEGAGLRANGIPFAAFGLVWKQFGEELCGGREAAALVEKALVVPTDANDNGIDLFSVRIPEVYPYPVSDAVRAFTPSWEEEQNHDARFGEAVEIAQKILAREVARARASIAGQKRVEAAYAASADKRLVVLDADYSWKEILAAHPEPLFVVLPQSGTWRLYCVRDNPHLFANRKDLPVAWAGLRERALTEATGVTDALFCHRNRFMAVACSKEGAVALAQQALKIVN